METKSKSRLSVWEVEDRIHRLQRKLSDSGHRVTPQRIHVLRAMLQMDTHPTAEDIWETVRQVSPTTALGTIYKTLDTLREMGEVMEIDAYDDSHHYDAVRPTAHPHVVCTDCGRIEDVDLEGLGSLQSQAAAASGFQIAEQRVTFYGLCRRCLE
jgi:Fur family peroxide stress response transcriptional regulator